MQTQQTVLTMPSTRNKLEIALEVLQLCRTPTGQTRIMNKVNLNHQQTREMITYLMFRGFLRRVDGEHGRVHGLYVTSNFGEEFASGLQLVLQIWFAAPVARHMKVLP